MYEFKLDEDQISKYEKWKKGQKKKDPFLPTAGERWKFSFVPTGLGTIVTVRDLTTDEEIDLTDWENF
jgi:hypothetical protein